ncbi:MAG: hypothetical protein RQ756_01780, partial [Flavobacteriaceae bacterium]|nr:hypothetical protein [Flavobacteriaceae bacterium]
MPMQLDPSMDVMDEKVTLEQCNIDGQEYFKIKNSHLMRPFFMSVVSDSNHWMFISSNGGLSAGRKDADHALFPYYTDDKITESSGITGSKTILRVRTDKEIIIWEPFSKRSINRFNIVRNIYKSCMGNSVIFEEINTDLELSFRYQWQSGDYFGFIRTSSLVNHSSNAIEIELIDGIQNVLPAGVGADLQTRVSNLVDAYKRTELHAESGLAIFALSSKIVDRAEPSEALKANVAWSRGTSVNHYLLSSKQLNAFRRKGIVTTETDIKAEKGAYLLQISKYLEPETRSSWEIIANVNIDHTGIVQLIETLRSNQQLEQRVEEDIEAGNQKLLKLCASADALQLTADTLRDSRHYSNVLF